MRACAPSTASRSRRAPCSGAWTAKARESSATSPSPSACARSRWPRRSPTSRPTGLISRRADPTDGRRMLVELTDAGLQPLQSDRRRPRGLAGRGDRRGPHPPRSSSCLPRPRSCWSAWPRTDGRPLRARCGSTTSAMSADPLAQLLLELAGEHGARRPATRSPPTPSVRNSTRPASVDSSLTRCGLAARCARARAASSPVTLALVALVGWRALQRALERLEVRLHRPPPPAARNRALDALGDLVRLAQIQLGGELQVQRDAAPLVLLEDRDVVRLLHERLRQRDREHPVAQVEAAPRAARRARPRRCPAARARPRPRSGRRRGGPRRPPGPAARSPRRRRSSVPPTRAGAGGSSSMSSPSAVDRALGRRARLRRRAVHQHVRVLRDQPHRGAQDDRRDHQRRHRVAVVRSPRDGEQPDEHRERARHVAGEVQRVRAQRRAVVAPRARAARRACG